MTIDRTQDPQATHWLLAKFDGDEVAAEHALTGMSVLEALEEVYRRERARRDAKLRESACRRVRFLLAQGVRPAADKLSPQQRPFLEEVLAEIEDAA